MITLSISEWMDESCGNSQPLLLYRVGGTLFIGQHSLGITFSPQLSGRPDWIDELFKVYGWVPGQIYPKPNKNSLKRKSLVYGLLIYQPISTADLAHQSWIGCAGWLDHIC